MYLFYTPRRGDSNEHTKLKNTQRYKKKNKSLKYPYIEEIPIDSKQIRISNGKWVIIIRVNEVLL